MSIALLSWTARTVSFPMSTSSLPAMSSGTVDSSSSSSSGHNRVPRLIHFNHAGCSPSPRAVTDRVIQYLVDEQRLGGYTTQFANDTQAELKSVYNSVATLIHAHDDSEIALVESATVAWTRLFYAMVNFQNERYQHPNNVTKVIWFSEAEYAANLVAAIRWVQQHDGWTIRMIPSNVMNDHQGRQVNVKEFSNLLRWTSNGTEVTAMVCVTHIPTNAGIINPVDQIGQDIATWNRQHQQQQQQQKDANQYEILYLVDACQSVGQIPINVQAMHCDGLVATGRKYLRGPRGTGFLYISKNWLSSDRGVGIWPSHLDHYSTPVVQLPSSDKLCLGAPLEEALTFAPRADAKRFEFWESNIANKLGLGVAVNIALKEGLSNIATLVGHLANLLYEKLRDMDGVHPYYPPKCGIVTFWVEGMKSEAVKEALWDEKGLCFEVSIVPATSTPLNSAITRAPNLVRASLSYTNTQDEVDLFCDRLAHIIQHKGGS